jgi:hypothetical protein
MCVVKDIDCPAFLPSKKGPAKHEIYGPTARYMSPLSLPQKSDRSAEVGSFLPLSGEMGDGGVKAAFDRSDGDLQHFPDLLVAELMEIAQEQDFAQVGRKRLDRLMHGLPKLGKLHRLVRYGAGGFEEVDELQFRVGRKGAVQLCGGVAHFRSERVAGLVGGDREQPRPEPPGRVEGRRRLVHLQKCLLKHILRRRPVAQKSNEKMVEFSLVAVHQLGERRPVAGHISSQQRLVAGGSRRKVGGVVGGEIQSAGLCV